mmetsp:Transcript_79589/g.212758  ORF Transcript_79589/g.212758 Transcript_79589/m.212758 type:complete len:728 (-) Transcript_79589:309-2492(-)
MVARHVSRGLEPRPTQQLAGLPRPKPGAGPQVQGVGDERGLLATLLFAPRPIPIPIRTHQIPRRLKPRGALKIRTLARPAVGTVRHGAVGVAYHRDLPTGHRHTRGRRPPPPIAYQGPVRPQTLPALQGTSGPRGEAGANAQVRRPLHLRRRAPHLQALHGVEDPVPADQGPGGHVPRLAPELALLSVGGAPAGAQVPPGVGDLPHAGAGRGAGGDLARLQGDQRRAAVPRRGPLALAPPPPPAAGLGTRTPGTPHAGLALRAAGGEVAGPALHGGGAAGDHDLGRFGDVPRPAAEGIPTLRGTGPPVRPGRKSAAAGAGRAGPGTTGGHIHQVRILLLTRGVRHRPPPLPPPAPAGGAAIGPRAPGRVATGVEGRGRGAVRGVLPVLLLLQLLLPLLHGVLKVLERAAQALLQDPQPRHHLPARLRKEQAHDVHAAQHHPHKDDQDQEPRQGGPPGGHGQDLGLVPEVLVALPRQQPVILPVHLLIRVVLLRRRARGRGPGAEPVLLVPGRPQGGVAAEGLAELPPPPAAVVEVHVPPFLLESRPPIHHLVQTVILPRNAVGGVDHRDDLLVVRGDLHVLRVGDLQPRVHLPGLPARVVHVPLPAVRLVGEVRPGVRAVRDHIRLRLAWPDHPPQPGAVVEDPVVTVVLAVGGPPRVVLLAVVVPAHVGVEVAVCEDDLLLNGVVRVRPVLRDWLEILPAGFRPLPQQPRGPAAQAQALDGHAAVV